MNVMVLTFEQIKEIWEKELWPNRESPIETHSAMTWPYDGNPLEFDMDIFKYDPSFFGVFHNGRIIGVNSGHRTKDNIYRSRGIWVDPESRKKGISQLLFDGTEKQAIKDAIWTCLLSTTKAAEEEEKRGWEMTDTEYRIDDVFEVTEMGDDG